MSTPVFEFTGIVRMPDYLRLDNIFVAIHITAPTLQEAIDQIPHVAAAYSWPMYASDSHDPEPDDIALVAVWEGRSEVHVYL